jgi:glutaconate CoA-transferase subunit B
MMAVALARQVRDREVAFVGVSSPLPLVAVLLAQRLHAPRATVVSIAGGINPRPSRLSAATTAAVLAEGSASVFDNADFYDLVARGGVDVTFLGAAQVDALGRINTTVIGPRERPTVRLPGGGGAAFILPLARRTVVWRAAHSPRIFVERCDFVTASGNLDRVVTPLCIFRLADGRLELESVHPYSSLDEVAARTGFAVRRDGVPTTPPPTVAELEALAQVDPDGVRRSEFPAVPPGS